MTPCGECVTAHAVLRLEVSVRRHAIRRSSHGGVEIFDGEKFVTAGAVGFRAVPEAVSPLRSGHGERDSALDGTRRSALAWPRPRRRHSAHGIGRKRACARRRALGARWSSARSARRAARVEPVLARRNPSTPRVQPARPQLQSLAKNDALASSTWSSSIAARAHEQRAAVALNLRLWHTRAQSLRVETLAIVRVDSLRCVSVWCAEWAHRGSACLNLRRASTLCGVEHASWLGFVVLGSAAAAAAILVWYLVKRPPIDTHVKLWLLLGLGVFPVLAAASSTVSGMEATTHREFCGSCHVMDSHFRNAIDPAGAITGRSPHAQSLFRRARAATCVTPTLRHVRLRFDQSWQGLRHVYEYYLGGYRQIRRWKRR